MPMPMKSDLSFTSSSSLVSLYIGLASLACPLSPPSERRAAAQGWYTLAPHASEPTFRGRHFQKRKAVASHAKNTTVHGCSDLAHSPSGLMRSN